MLVMNLVLFHVLCVSLVCRMSHWCVVCLTGVSCISLVCCVSHWCVVCVAGESEVDILYRCFGDGMHDFYCFLNMRLFYFMILQLLFKLQHQAHVKVLTRLCSAKEKVNLLNYNEFIWSTVCDIFRGHYKKMAITIFITLFIM